MIIILFSMIAFAGCDASLKYNKIEILKYPSKLKYYIGIDHELDLSDGEIKLTTISKHFDIVNIVPFDTDGNGEFEIEHTIDFSIEGNCVVEICRAPDLCVSLTIQVINSKPSPE